jgi:glycosyltransferase involved in cell wall biosynthesis
LLSTVKKYDFIFIHREATPLGPPWFEWVTAKIFHKRIIYDFDDAIWLPHVSSENKGIRFLKWHRKIGLLCKWSDKVSCGNAFLCDFAKHYNKNVFLNPTTIDTQSVHNPNHGAMVKSNRLTIGWTGTHSTLKYLKLLQQVLVRLQLKYSDKIDVVVIADRPPEMNIDYTFIKWSKNTEITDLLRFDIGIMPLEDDEWAKGKCGFKALQYMALKIPTIASAVGVNTTIIKNQDTGLLCTTELEWELALISLIENPALRQRLGERGRQTVEAHYSTSSNQDNFLSFFE